MAGIRPSIEDLHIVHYPDPILREVAKPVEEVTDELREIAEKMVSVMDEERGVGLAAPQVGVSLRLILLKSLVEDFGEDGPSDGPHDIAFINPVIVARKGYLTEEEGCLSLPEVKAKIRRSERVTVRAWDLDGKEHEIKSEGIIARAWQHEIDHLDGILIVDKMSPASKIGNARKLRRLELDAGER